jgi:single-strand DNA-binding protein
MASRSVNKVILIGNLGKDAETKFTPSGVAKTTFSVATSRRFKQGEEWQEATTWTNVVVWRNEKLGEYLTKGKLVYVEGRLETRSYDKDGEKRYVTEVVADDVILLGGRESGGEERPVSAPRSSRQAPAAAKAASYDDMGITDDDVPFMRYDVPCL